MFAFHEDEEIGPRMLARIAKRTGLIMMSRAKRGLSGHFRREAKIMAAFIVGLVLVGLLVGVLAPRIAQSLAVDRCLDAGGRYNYQLRVCEGARTDSK